MSHHNILPHIAHSYDVTESYRFPLKKTTKNSLFGLRSVYTNNITYILVCVRNITTDWTFEHQAQVLCFKMVTDAKQLRFPGSNNDYGYMHN